MSVVQMARRIQSHGFFSHYQGASYFWLFTGIMAVNTVLYYAAIFIFKIKDTQTAGLAMDEMHQ